MSSDFILNLLEHYGFPITMCIWFMLRTEKKLDAIEETNHKQVVVMAVLVRILGDKKSLGAIPDTYFDEITGVNEIPLPGQSTRDAKAQSTSSDERKNQ